MDERDESKYRKRQLTLCLRNRSRLVESVVLWKRAGLAAFEHHNRASRMYPVAKAVVLWHGGCDSQAHHKRLQGVAAHTVHQVS
jgi:hypothetical protein